MRPRADVGRRIRARRAADRALVDINDAGDILQAEDRLVSPRLEGGVIQFVCNGLIKYVVDELDLPEPETPVTAVKRRRGMSTSTSFRLFACAPRIFRNSCPFARGFLDPSAALHRGTSMNFLPRKYCSVSEFASYL